MLLDRFFVVGSRDMTSRIFSLFPMTSFSPVTLSGHRNSVTGCYFEKNSLDVSLLYWHVQHTLLCNRKLMLILKLKLTQLKLIQIGGALNSFRIKEIPKETYQFVVTTGQEFISTQYKKNKQTKEI